MRVAHRPSLLSLLACLSLFPSTLATVAHAADAPPSAPAGPSSPPPKPPLPPGIVARVRDQNVTLADFRRYLVEATKKEVEEPNSGPYTVLHVLFESVVVRQEAERLHIVVTPEDYGRRYDELDRKLRATSGGRQTLKDLLEQTHKPPEVFQEQLENQIRKEKVAADKQWLGSSLPKDERQLLAQLEVVAGQLLKRATIVTTGLAPGVVATVNGEAVTVDRFGEALYRYLGESDVRNHLRTKCFSVILDQEGLSLTPEQADQALELERPRWRHWIDEEIDPEKRALTFEGYLQMRYGAPVAEIKSSSYHRGMLALRMKYWKAVTDLEIDAEWTKNADTKYGPAIVVTEIEVSYQIPGAVTEPVARRPRAEALRIASDFVRRGRSGESAKSILKEVTDLKERSIVGTRRAIQRPVSTGPAEVGKDVTLFRALSTMSDGTWSEPIEEYSEYHVLYRESSRPAQPLEKVREVVRQRLADEKVAAYLTEFVRTNVQTGY